MSALPSWSLETPETDPRFLHTATGAYSFTNKRVGPTKGDDHWSQVMMVLETEQVGLLS